MMNALLVAVALAAALPARKDPAPCKAGTPGAKCISGNDVNAILERLDGTEPLDSTVKSTGSTTARSLADRFREVVNVRDFGARSTSDVGCDAAGTTWLGTGSLPCTNFDSRPAFQAAHDALSAAGNSLGGEIVIPPGKYKLSQEWAIKKRVFIRGAHAGNQQQYAATILTFPANTNGIRFYSSQDSGGGESSGSRIVRVQVEGTLTGSTSGVGIKATAQVHVEDCYVRTFKGHGIEISGDATKGQGNSNFWAVRRTRVVLCGGDGLYVHGADANVGVAEQVQSLDNTGWGFNDEGKYTNTYIGCEAGGNDAGSYRAATDTETAYYGALYLGCYVEFDSGQTPSIDSNAIVIGGTLSAKTSMANTLGLGYPNGLGFNLYNRFIFWRNGTEVARFDTDNQWKASWFEPTASTVSTVGTYFSRARIAFVNGGASASDVARFDNGNGRVGSITTNGSATAYNTSSDYRLKNDVQPMAGALERIALLRPVTYRWKVDGSAGEGFIAHELQEVFPGAVTGEKDGAEMQAVDPSKIVAALVAAVQELKAEVEALKARP